MSDKHRLEDMTWVEFRERLAERPVILLPFGSQEEQGPHTPMGDFVLTRRIAEMMAQRAGAIVAPTIPFGYADFFRTVPGGIQLRADTFARVLEDMTSAFLDHDIERIVIVNGHSSNAPLIDQTTRLIRRARGVAIPALHIWRLIPADVWKEIYGEKAGPARGHGADPLTSVYLQLFPELLRPDLAAPAMPRQAFGLKADGVGGVQFAGASVAMPLDVTDVTGNGVIAGDPAVASAAAGAAIVEWLVDYGAKFIAHWRACDPRNVAVGPETSK